ncbi:unnamed protein product [Arabidopsis halleri]
MWLTVARCGDKWIPGHRCKGREFKYMAVDEGDELDEDDEAETGKKSGGSELRWLVWILDSEGAVETPSSGIHKPGSKLIGIGISERFRSRFLGIIPGTSGC